MNNSTGEKRYRKKMKYERGDKRGARDLIGQDEKRERGEESEKREKRN